MFSATDIVNKNLRKKAANKNNMYAALDPINDINSFKLPEI